MGEMQLIHVRIILQGQLPRKPPKKNTFGETCHKLKDYTAGLEMSGVCGDDEAVAVIEKSAEGPVAKRMVFYMQPVLPLACVAGRKASSEKSCGLSDIMSPTPAKGL